MERVFKWRSPLGIATIIFLLYGLFNSLSAIFVPISLHLNGVGAMFGTVVSVEADSKVLGRSLMTLPKDDPGLNSYIVAYMDTMCMEMMAAGLLQIAIAWFALRCGHMWSVWTLAIADLSFIPYLVGWTSIFSSYGISALDSITSFGGFWILLTVVVIVATVLG